MGNISVHMTPDMVAEVMGIPERPGLGPIAWILIQEEAKGTGREGVASALDVSVGDLEELIHGICQKGSLEESLTTWAMGVVALKTSALMMRQVLEGGWDAVEAMAISKLSQSLTKMQTDGDPEQMLRIATNANKALRRGKGENPGQPGGGGPTQVNVNVLQAGKLGSIKLNLAPRIQKQLSDPNRVIDANPKANSLGQKEMLNLEATRELLDGKEQEYVQSTPLDKKKDRFNFDLSEVGDLGEFLKNV